MTIIKAETILSSQHSQRPDKHLTTMLLTYPRWIHAEGRTHRLLRILEDMEVYIRTPSLMEDENLSRNASSSRAIPVEKMIQDVMENPAIPLFWGKNQKGMQASMETDELVSCPTFSGGCEDLTNRDAWLRARDFAVAMARSFADAGYHKQIINRLLEPFSHIRVLVSATEWSNFLGLRDHEDAEPHIAMLAREVRKELDKPAMQMLQPGDWHLPFVGDIRNVMVQRLTEKDFIKMSAACSASTSYKTVDGFDMTMERADYIFSKLVEKPPLHASPFEHVAQADEWVSFEKADRPHYNSNMDWANSSLHGNFEGFCQYRKMLPNECL